VVWCGAADHLHPLNRGSGDIAGDNRPAIPFFLPTRGYQEIHQFHRMRRCQANSLILVSMSEPFLQLKPKDHDTNCLLVGSDFSAHCISRMRARVILTSSALPRLFQDSPIALKRESRDAASSGRQ